MHLGLSMAESMSGWEEDAMDAALELAAGAVDPAFLAHGVGLNFTAFYAEIHLSPTLQDEGKGTCGGCRIITGQHYTVRKRNLAGNGLMA